MKADTVNRWLTLCANFGVVIGLILLIIELDQNTDLVRAEIHQARSDVHVSNRLEHADSDVRFLAWQKFLAAGGSDDLAALDQLTQLEAARVLETIAAYHQEYDNLFYQYQQGYLDEEYYRYRVETSIRRWAPWWNKFGMFIGGRRPSYDAEIKRIMADN